MFSCTTPPGAHLDLSPDSGRPRPSTACAAACPAAAALPAAPPPVLATADEVPPPVLPWLRVGARAAPTVVAVDPAASDDAAADAVPVCAGEPAATVVVFGVVFAAGRDMITTCRSAITTSGGP